MSKAVRIHEVGGPEVLKFETVEVGDPGPGQALLRQTAAGLNYIDTYQPDRTVSAGIFSGGSGHGRRRCGRGGG